MAKGKNKPVARAMVKVIKAVRKEKTGAYGFQEKMISKEDVKEYLSEK